MYRIALGVEYCGTLYHGWQKQREENVPTVQGVLERALSIVADHPVMVHCAGRTDKGVHATGQVVHFDTQSVRTERAWLLGTNAHLPHDVRVTWVQFVDEHFHARFAATRRRYHYWIDNRPMASALLYQKITWYLHPLNESLMQIAAQHLLGEHDFSSFRGKDCQADSPVRTVYEVNVKRLQHRVVLDICANGFLHHMVRNIVGVLLEVGRGRADPNWVAQLLQVRNRSLAAMTAPSDGLYLVDVEYPGYQLNKRECVYELV